MGKNNNKSVVIEEDVTVEILPAVEESPIEEPAVEESPIEEPVVEESPIEELTKSERIKKHAQAELDKFAKEADERTLKVEEMEKTYDED